jgi:glutamate N-acetyltransferase/amino-acid N-acetyltransferase
MKLPNGFEMAGTKAGIKTSGLPDLGLIYCSKPTSWALVSTSNQVKAACVARNRTNYGSGKTIRAIAVNSGNANAATGNQGIRDDEDFAVLTANALNLNDPQSVLTASTGVIGVQLPIDRIKQALPNLAERLQPDSTAFAESILTTDTATKEVAVRLKNGALVVGIAKGSGMIHPNMATMLAFVLTDAVISQDNLRDLWPSIVDESFNQLTVDGDTSTNDMGFLMSSNQVKEDAQQFTDALNSVCRGLAEKIAQDGEGATKLIVVKAQGARSVNEARLAARAVALSPLVKTAVHGNDPNWGRILAAVGASGAVFNQEKLLVKLQGTVVYNSAPHEFDFEILSTAMKAKKVLIEIDLLAGSHSATAWGCDLSSEYIRINAEYTT